MSEVMKTMSEEEILKELKKLNSWMKIQSRDELKTLVEQEDEINKVLISEADGEKSIRDFVENVPRSYQPTYGRLKKLKRLGILRENADGKLESQCSLEELDIEQPELEVEDDE